MKVVQKKEEKERTLTLLLQNQKIITIQEIRNFYIIKKNWKNFQKSFKILLVMKMKRKKVKNDKGMMKKKQKIPKKLAYNQKKNNKNLCCVH